MGSDISRGRDYINSFMVLKAHLACLQSSLPTTRKETAASPHNSIDSQRHRGLEESLTPHFTLSQLITALKEARII